MKTKKKKYAACGKKVLKRNVLYLPNAICGSADTHAPENMPSKSIA